jgi:hypothetical protein
MIAKCLVVSVGLLGIACGNSASSNNTAMASGAPAPAPPGTLKCTKVGGNGALDRCSCELATAKEGACSPQSLGSASHCCASVSASGSTTQCNCRVDVTTRCCLSGNRCSCELNSPCLSEGGGKAAEVPSCGAPTGGHCCAGTEGACSCSAAVCEPGREEVATCASSLAVIKCLAPAISVSSCQ